jgi:hypothetical protein
MPPENHHTREPHQPTYAILVDGTYYCSHCSANHHQRSAIPYEIKLTRTGPGAVEFKLTIDGSAYGTMPFDNLVKAATRIDPDHAVGPEKQIRELREEVAKARAAMYDQQARADQAEQRVHALEAELKQKNDATD